MIEFIRGMRMPLRMTVIQQRERVRDPEVAQSQQHERASLRIHDGR
jgi:hypothetical protein